ncbi:Uncharacterised protein [Mycobacteroides abscessus subsp. abscessus]|nr:Uncharacterised protein [Mycobacteroides abscessus subsp. abscessus]
MSLVSAPRSWMCATAYGGVKTWPGKGKLTMQKVATVPFPSSGYGLPSSVRQREQNCGAGQYARSQFGHLRARSSRRANPRRKTERPVPATYV